MNSTRPLDLTGLLPYPRECYAARRRRRLGGVLLILGASTLLGLLALTGAARAQDAPANCDDLRSATGDLEAEPTRHELDGVAGMWFPTPIARLMLCEVRLFRLRTREIRLVDSELHLWEQRVEFTERELSLAVEARDRLLEVVDRAERRAREAEEALDVWYRSPFLWVVVGAVIGGGLIIGGAYVAGAVP